MFKPMFSILCKKQLIVAASNVRVSSFGCCQKFSNLPQNASLIIRSFCESANNVSDQQHSVTLSFLTSSCGLSPDAAAVVSKSYNLKSPERADSMLTILKSHGFNDAHITKLITKFPKMLSVHPEKTVLPKLRFFHSIGMSAPVLVRMVCRNPTILIYSLDKSIIPFYHYLKDLLQTDEKVILVFKGPASYFLRNSLSRIPPNVDILRKYGVSDSNISYMVVYSPYTLVKRSDELIKLVERVIELGIDISKSKFAMALEVLGNFSEAAWESREEVYRKWGWSDSDIRTAFLLQPYCMRISEKKIMSIMEFLVNEMNCHPKDIARSPYILLLSLEKRIKPRCRVVKLLMEKGLIKKSNSIYSFLQITENDFLERFVRKYDTVPQLLDVYRR